MNNKTVNSVRSGLRHLALGTVVGSMMFVSVACGGSPAPTPTASSTTTSTTSPSPAESGSPTSSTGTQGASETVTVTEETGVETAPAGEASPKPAGGQPLARPAVQQITRDPFVNPLTGGGGMASAPTVRPTPANTPKVTPASTPGSSGSSGSKPSSTAATEEQEEVPPPDVTVTGIVQGTSGAMAIISGPEQSYIRRVGESLAEYKVLAISPKAVTFGFKGRKFKVKLQDEFGAGATGTKATPKRQK